MVDLFRYRHWDLVSKRGIYYVLSGSLILLGIIALFFTGSGPAKSLPGLKKGIDFLGGGQVTYTLPGHIALGKTDEVQRTVSDDLTKAGIENQVLYSPGGKDSTGDQIVVRSLLTKEQGSTKFSETFTEQINSTITPEINKVATQYIPGAKTIAPDGRDMVSGTVKSELKARGGLALLLGSILIMFWIWLRYNIGGFGFRYSAGGILALLHDLMILVGMFAIFHKFLEVNSPFIAALLTVLGYSIHDTIVIYDRIRENMRLRKGRTFAETVNISLLETMARSVNTILTVLFTLLALLFFGGPSLRDFVAAMLIGVVVGGYSSIFIASQLLVTWSKGKDRVILPLGESVTASAAAMPKVIPQTAPVAAVATATEAPRSAASVNRDEAIQRAKQAGKTSKRRR